MNLEAAVVEQISTAVVAEIRRRLNDAPADEATRVAPRYMTVEQAGSYIGKTASAIHTMVSRKEIPAIHAGYRTVRIDRVDLDAWAAKRRY